MRQDVPPPLPVVLVVEDEGFVRLMAVDMLEDAGFGVIEAGTADEAWRILERRFDDVTVLFTDIDMPGSMDGVALASRVAVCWPHIRLVVTSGRHCLSDADMPDHGRFVHKPYHVSQVMSAVANAA